MHYWLFSLTKIGYFCLTLNGDFLLTLTLCFFFICVKCSCHSFLYGMYFTLLSFCFLGVGVLTVTDIFLTDVEDYK